MTKTADYRIVEVHQKRKLQDEVVSYNIQRRACVLGIPFLKRWEVKEELNHKMSHSWFAPKDYYSIEFAILGINKWHEYLYAEHYKKSTVVKTVTLTIKD